MILEVGNLYRLKQMLYTHSSNHSYLRCEIKEGEIVQVLKYEIQNYYFGMVLFLHKNKIFQRTMFRGVLNSYFERLT